MRIHIPADGRRVVARQRRDEISRDVESAARDEEKARAQALTRTEALDSARHALGFARALAAKLTLPPNGLEIFAVYEGRCETRVRALQNGALLLDHVVHPFAAFRIHATVEAELVKAPRDLLDALVAAIDSGEVWQHVRSRS